MACPLKIFHNLCSTKITGVLSKGTVLKNKRSFSMRKNEIRLPCLTWNSQCVSFPGKTKTALRKHLTWILSSPMLSSLASSSRIWIPGNLSCSNDSSKRSSCSLEKAVLRRLLRSASPRNKKNKSCSVSGVKACYKRHIQGTTNLWPAHEN